MLKIDKFPHAQYDSKTKIGFLAYYYPSAALRDKILDEDDWRYNSLSPEILNYKEGKNADIEFFVGPFLKLIHYAMTDAKVDEAFLVPIPSSMAVNDPRFSTMPRQKSVRGNRNRDNRNSIFCSLLSVADGSLKVADNLVRTKTKPEKVAWGAKQHTESMKLRAVSALPHGKIALITIDDVRTDGGTSSGAHRILKEAYPQAIIISLTIAHTRSPQQFLPLS